jgi:hypothetical protein
MNTRGNHPDYHLLHNGYEAGAAPSEDWMSSLSDHDQEGYIIPLPPYPFTYLNLIIIYYIRDSNSLLDHEVLPSESASQLPPQPSSQVSSQPSPQLATFRNTRKPTKNQWLWSYFRIREFPYEWVQHRGQKKRIIDREINCTVGQCNWSTTDSKRQGSTSNILIHLRDKHGILPPTPATTSASDLVVTTPKSTIQDLWGSKLTTQQATNQALEKNLLHWVVRSKQPFTVIESPEFQRLFHDIPGM